MPQKKDFERNFTDYTVHITTGSKKLQKSLK